MKVGLIDLAKIDMNVFILSSREQQHLHRAIQDFLNERGVGVWMDAADDGSDWTEKLAGWFRDSDLIIALATPEYVASAYSRQAWQIAAQCPTPKLVLRFREQELSSPSQATTVVDCADEAQAPLLVYEFIRSKQQMRIFVSYSHRNGGEMRQFVELLKHSLNKVWVDGSGLKHGEDFSKKIRGEIEACDHFLLLWSRHGRASRWVEQEWNYAFKLGKRILPVLLDSTPLPMVLEQIHAFSTLQDARLREFFSIPPSDDRRNVRGRRSLWKRLTRMLAGQQTDAGDA